MSAPPSLFVSVVVNSLFMYACATTFMTSVVTCAILYVGNSLVSEGSLTTGTLVSFLLYQYNLTGALSSIADIWSGMQEAIGSARKIFSILDRQPALRNDGVCCDNTKIQ